MSATTYGAVSTQSTPQMGTPTTNSAKQRNSRLSTHLSGRYPQATRVLLPKPNNSGFITSSSSGNSSVHINYQTNVAATPDTLGVIRMQNTEKCTVGQRSVGCNTITGGNIPTLSPNSFTTSSETVKPAAATRKRNSPLTDISNATIQSPFVTPVNETSKRTSRSFSHTNIPVLTTQKSTYEVGESSRRTKRSKRPPLQSRTPIAFRLDDDVHVRKDYDKYVGISEEYYDHGDPTFECTSCHAFSSSKTSAPSNSKTPIDRSIINQVKDVLDESSDLVKTFRRAREAYTEDNEQNIRIKLIAKRGKDGRQYDLPTANEVAGLIVGDLDACAEDRDIELQTPLTVWLETWHLLAHDVEYKRSQILNIPGLRLSDDEKKNVALFWIEQLMLSRGTTLRRFPEMPYPDSRYTNQFAVRSVVNGLGARSKFEIYLGSCSLGPALYAEEEICRFCKDSFKFDEPNGMRDHEKLCQKVLNLDATGKPKKNYRKKVVKNVATSSTVGSKDDEFDVDIPTCPTT
ncbi:hypothetical protein CTI12_AA076990 [Artemisia annua]|uniref:Uncharacterized protein n=1 Tax=Artemisia annua TaxID=35608 RepID=A0A2U1Q4E1_ARTAN|nr:hypothetical protein CTI12_AA076990 [Artemisia annua]